MNGEVEVRGLLPGGADAKAGVRGQHLCLLLKERPSSDVQGQVGVKVEFAPSVGAAMGVE